MKIGELAKRTGLSAHTIRYYERIGLLSYASRTESKHREYDETILLWMDFIGRLRASGMPVREMLCYAELREQGVGTENARVQLLKQHRDRVLVQLDELNLCLGVIDKKIAGYMDDTKEIRKHDEKLPKRNRKPTSKRD